MLNIRANAALFLQLGQKIAETFYTHARMLSTQKASILLDLLVYRVPRSQGVHWPLAIWLSAQAPEDMRILANLLRSKRYGLRRPQKQKKARKTRKAEGAAAAGACALLTASNKQLRSKRLPVCVPSLGVSAGPSCRLGARRFSQRAIALAACTYRLIATAM